MQQRTVDLSRVEILVLDEADRMLDMGFIRDIRRILNILPPRRQNLLFSATFSNEIKGLADDLLNNPTHVEVARKNAESDLVTQAVYLSHKENKRDLLVHLLIQEKIGQALVFMRTKHGADKLVKQLQRRRRLGGSHSRQPQPGRSAPAPSPTSKPARCASWSRPTSPRAASTSTNCRMSSTTTAQRSRGLCPSHRAYRPRGQQGRSPLPRQHDEQGYLNDIES